jgi:hypothetical protein
MGFSRLNLVAPSGAAVDVDLPDDAPVSNVAAAVRFVGGSYGTGFQIGPRGYHEFAATVVAPATQRDRLLVHGREVVVVEADDGTSSWATLLGTYHELMTVYAGPAPRRDRVRALFSSLQITDRVGGMVVRPRAATLLDTMTEQLMIVVRGRGSLCIPGPRQARALIPRHAGAPTRHGEVWKAPYAGASGASGARAASASRYQFILGCPRGVAEVQLVRTPAVAESDQLAWLDGINVAWRQG